MEKLTKSLPLFKERNCSVSIVLDARTRRKNAYELINRSQTVGDKLHGQKGNSPDRQLRSQNND